MKPARPAAQRGHLLLEAVVGGAVSAIALSAVLAHSAAFHARFGQAVADQQAALAVRRLVEEWRALPDSSPQWKPGVYSGAIPGTPWTYTVTVSVVTETLLPFSPVEKLTYRRAVLSVAYRGRSATLETIK